MCDTVRPVPHNLFAPNIENSVEDLKSLVYGKLHRLYGENPPELITKRVETELHDIINCHYDVIYMSAQKLVQNSLEHGYLVGSRGSVGSSIVAYHVRHHGGQLLPASLPLPQPGVQVHHLRRSQGLRLRRGFAGRCLPQVRRQVCQGRLQHPL